MLKRIPKKGMFIFWFMIIYALHIAYELVSSVQTGQELKAHVFDQISHAYSVTSQVTSPDPQFLST